MLNIKLNIIPVKPYNPKNSKTFDIVLFSATIVSICLMLYYVVPEKRNFQKIQDARSFIPYIADSFFDIPLHSVYIVKQRCVSRVRITGKADSLEKLTQWYDDNVDRNKNFLKLIPEVHGNSDFQDFIFKNVVRSNNGRPINQRITVSRTNGTVWIEVVFYY